MSEQKKIRSFSSTKIQTVLLTKNLDKSSIFNYKALLN